MLVTYRSFQEEFQRGISFGDELQYFVEMLA
jgi:hypothetical protein